MNSCTSTFESACAAVQDVHHRYREQTRAAPCARLRIQGFFASAAAACAAAIDTPSSALAPAASSGCRPADHLPVERRLVQFGADDGLGDFAVHVATRPSGPLGQIALLVAIAQLERLALAGRRTRGHRARPNAPLASVTSTSTVGFPRESRISLPARWRFSRLSPVVFGFDAERFFADRLEQADRRLR